VDFFVNFESGQSLLDHTALTLDLQEFLGRKADVVTRYHCTPG
jgi:predicted nucleotidyltransferase